MKLYVGITDKDWYHGQKLLVLPNYVDQMPQRDYLNWHNEHVYLG